MMILGSVRTLLLSLGFCLIATTVLAAGPSYKIEVAGLSCPFCAYGVEKKLGALDGVESVETHIKKGAVFVTMTEGATLEKSAADEALKDAGFKLKEFDRLPEEAGQ